LYVIHGVNGYAMLSILSGMNINPSISIAITMMVVFLLAFILHLVVEDPSNRLGKALITTVGKKMGPGAGPTKAD